MKLLQSRSSCIGIIGIFLFSFGLVLLLIWAWIFDVIIASMLVLKPNSQLYDIWRKPPIDTPLDFYFLNWTNPEEINNLTTKPRFQEMGPYRFLEIKEKVNVTWNPNSTVTYKLLRSWYFDKKFSVGMLTDSVTTLNVVAASAANQVRDWSYMMKRGLSMSLSTMAPHVHITRTVAELLFDGYPDPLIDLAKTMPFLADTIPPYDKFGWFYLRNNSYVFDGTFNIATGADKNNLGELLKWNYEGQTKYFDGACGKVHGSAAELYPQWSTKDSVGFFSPDMCRHVQLDYEGDVLVKGVTGYKYSSQLSMLDNGTLVPENKCYCDGECVPSGMLNVSSCRYGTPAFVSLPHFYNADPVYQTMLDGLKPDRDKHEIYLTLEPRTGVPLDVAIRLQLNLRLRPVEHVTLYENVPTVFFPMLWFEQRVTLPDDLVWQMKMLQKAPTIFPAIGVTLMTIGLLLVIYATYKTCIKTLYDNKCKGNPQTRDEVPLKPNPTEYYVPSEPNSNSLLVTDRNW